MYKITVTDAVMNTSYCIRIVEILFRTYVRDFCKNLTEIYIVDRPLNGDLCLETLLLNLIMISEKF